MPGVTSIRVEKKSDEFIPDITLVGKETIWIEFAVTHPCSAAKLNAKQKIIEIRIQQEADVELFRQHKPSAQDPRVKFIHFPDRVPNDMCRWYKYCRLAKRVFVIHHNGKLEIQYLDKKQELAEGLKAKAAWWTEEYIYKGDEPMTRRIMNICCRRRRSVWTTRPGQRVSKFGRVAFVCIMTGMVTPDV